MRPQPHSINAIIRELHKFTKATFDARYRFDFDLDANEPSVHVDSGAIEQVLLNLYLNARDAMPDGGIVSTQTKVVFDDQKEPWAQIRITDTGPGIPQELLGEIFDPFFTTKAGQAGTGLGLSTSRRLILDQNGRIEYVSTDSEGGCFEIVLPVTQRVEPTPAEFKKPEVPVCQAVKKTVLVVDDEDGIRKVASAILEMYGFEAITAVNGEAALSVLRTDHQRIDMVLLDMTMPGISGLDVLEIASAEYPDIPVVLCSGYLAGVSDEIDDKCLQLPKPFSAEDLIAMVNQAVNVDAVAGQA